MFARLANTTAKRRRSRELKTLGYQFATFDVYIVCVYIIDNINVTSIIELMDLRPLFTHMSPPVTRPGVVKTVMVLFVDISRRARTRYFRETHDATSNTVSDSTGFSLRDYKKHVYKRRAVLRAYFVPYEIVVRHRQCRLNAFRRVVCHWFVVHAACTRGTYRRLGVSTQIICTKKETAISMYRHRQRTW